ncbi:hypothetical protein D3C77_323200 [compost metagenome]
MEKDADHNTSNRYSAVFTKPFDLESKLAAYDMRLDAPKPNLGEVKRAVVELRRLLAEGLPQEGDKDIFGSISEDLAKENLIRSPELIARVRQEIAKYDEIAAMAAKLDAVLEQHQDEEKWLEQFIEAIYTGTIAKKGALYVYDRDPEEEAWEPFANLMKSRNYVEYEVFTHFRGLDEKNLSALMRKASRRDAELTASEDVGPLLQTLDELAEQFQEGRDSLEYEKVELANGEEMYQFYRQVTAKLNDIRRRLK